MGMFCLKRRSCLQWLCACAAAIIAPANISQADELPPRPNYRIESDIVYGNADGVELELDAYVPSGDGPFPAALVIHGGAWRAGTKEQLGRYARRLADGGIVAFAINYRLAPRHKFPAQIDDCRTALRWVVDHAARFKIDPHRLGAIGYSAGGHLSAMLATEPTKRNESSKAPIRLSGVAIGGAPCDFRDLDQDSRGLAFWLGGSRASLPELYTAASPAAFVTPDDPPMFFWHGEWDRLVPLAGATAMSDKLKKAGIETQFHLVAQSGHIYAAFDPPAVEKAINFLEQKLSASDLADQQIQRSE